MRETLLDVFVPPEGMVGHSAALVAMTGATDFLEAAMVRFTGLGRRQRQELGAICAYLMLDGHASESRECILQPGSIPGLHEFHPRQEHPASLRSLLHAKLALLAFAPNRTGKPTHLRLAVLSANFTYTSARHQLELVWMVDVSVGSSGRDNQRQQDGADVAAAADFVKQLLARRFYRDEKTLPPKHRRLTRRLDTLLASASRVGSHEKPPRFIHSFQRPLYDQIHERFRTLIRSPRNLLLCGSGFYERPDGTAQKPEVLAKLEQLGKFSTSMRRIVLVEPREAGAIASWAAQSNNDGWQIARPSDDLGLRRRLHAKFVYAGYWRDGHASNGCLYLGSGNLSRQGLLSSLADPDGSIECGVVIQVAERLPPDELRRRLFWDPEAPAIKSAEFAAGQVGTMEEQPPYLESPPILSAHIELEPNRMLRLLWRDNDDDRAVVWRASIRWDGHDWEAVGEQQPNVALLEQDCPATLRVRNDDSLQEWTIPVADPDGRVCWRPSSFLTYEDALAALQDFPLPPVESVDEDDELDSAGSPAASGSPVSSRNEEKCYPLFRAAEVIESIAAQGAALPKDRIDDWLDHLDRWLQAPFTVQLLTAWKRKNIDVLSHLSAPKLSPALAKKSQNNRYPAILDRVKRIVEAQ
jgi:hypothetical protein